VGSYYTYLISSLPMLQFGCYPPFAFKTFIDTISKDHLSDNDRELLLRIRISGEYEDIPNEICMKWHDFDTVLRNEKI
jgi:hypothetical protein